MRYLLPVLLATTLLSPLADADAATHARRCPAGAIRIVVSGAGVRCAAYPASAKARARVAVTARSLLAQLPKRRRPRVSAKDLRQLDRVAAAALAAPRSRAVTAHAAAAGDCAALQPGPLQKVDPAEIGAPAGADVVGSQVKQAPDDATPTQGADLAVVVRDGGERRETRERSCWSWDPCPAADGSVHGHHEHLKTESITVVDPKTRNRVTARNRFAYDTDLVAHVGDDARVATFDLKTFISVEKGGDVRDAAGHLVEHTPTKRYVVSMSITGVDPRVDTHTSVVTATARGPKGDKLSGGEVDGLSVLTAIALQDVRENAVDDGLIKTAEAGWFDRFLCVKVALDPQQAVLHAGQTIPIGVSATAKDGGAVHGTMDASAYNGSVTPAHEAAPGTLQYTADDPLRDGPMPTVDVTVTSKRGRGHAVGGGAKPAAPPGPAQYRILDASLHTDSTGAKTASDEQPCADGGFPIHGETIVDAASTGPDPDLVTLKSGYGGRVSGDFTTGVDGKDSFSLVGCQGFSPKTYCSTSFDRTLASGQTVGMDLEADSADAQTATLTWAIGEASVGFVDYDDSVCNVSDMFGGLTFEQESQTVPMAQFTGTQPFTLEFDGQADWSTDGHGKAATIHMDWKCFLTLQRVG